MRQYFHLSQLEGSAFYNFAALLSFLILLGQWKKAIDE